MAAWNQKRRDPATLEERRVRGVKMVMEQGLSEHEVARALGVTQGAVSKWMKAYDEGGGGNSYETLKRGKHPGKPRMLTEKQLVRIPGMLAKGAKYWGFSTDIWTGERVARLIRVKFKVRYNPMYVTRILHSLGLSWQKVEKVAREQDREKLRDWVLNTLPK
jgi:transposase